MGKLIDQLIKLSESGMYPMHMPGHKRQTGAKADILSNIRKLDITEIDDFDDLHACSGVLKEIQSRIAAAYGAVESSILVNGSTGGILSAISACAGYGDRILMARNSHKSAYNAAVIRGLKVSYIYPKQHSEAGICKGITADQVRESLEAGKKIKAVYITSPTYEGICSEIEAIAKIVHSFNIPLIIDAAHGAHLGIDAEYDGLCNTGNIVGAADIVIQSLHKTLPAFTQSAVIHYKKGLVDVEKLKYYLSVYQSSSPSYILMAGIEGCFDILENKNQLFRKYIENLTALYDSCKALKYLKLLRADDIGKIVILTEGSSIKGEELYRLLRERYKIQPEMASLEYVVCMTSIMDTKEAFLHLAQTICEIDKQLTFGSRSVNTYSMSPKAKYSIAEALNICEENNRLMAPEAAIGKTSGVFVYAYPPGIPIITPGEIIDEECLAVFKMYSNHTLDLRGLKEGKIKVLDE